VAHHCVGRAAWLAVVAATTLVIGLPNGQAEPLAIPAASNSWERFDPTLELPRIYNPDGSLPPNAEMPGEAVMPDVSAVPTLPPPDAIEPASASAPRPPAVTRGDPPAAAAAARAPNDQDQRDQDQNDPNDRNDDATLNASLHELDPEAALNAPSTLDPSQGLNDPSGAAVGNAQAYQNQQVDPPAVVLIPPPFYYRRFPGQRPPPYGYRYYGPALGRFPYPAHRGPLPQPIPPNASFGAMPPPGYPWIGGSPMVPWSSTHPILPPGRLLMPSVPMR
jgi:hypothetical protein